MSMINETHIEWAVVNRLKAMLDEPPRTEFNVTQTFSLFTTIVLWVKNRAWTRGDDERPRPLLTSEDRSAHSTRERLWLDTIGNAPWCLPTVPLRLSGQRSKLTVVPRAGPGLVVAEPINADFATMNAADFFEWLRNALAHSDGRKITPIHFPEKIQGNQASLIGFVIANRRSEQESEVIKLTLYEDDMRRMGAKLADMFCKALSGNDAYFEGDAQRAKIVELARAS